MIHKTAALQANPITITVNNDLIARIEDLEDFREEIVSYYEAFTEEQLHFRPEPGHWNLLQVLDHIVTSEKMSAIYIRRELSGKKFPPPPGLQSRFRYAILKLAFKLPFRFKAPSIVDSTGKNPSLDQLLESWETIRGQIRSIAESTDEELLGLGVYKHPRAGLLDMDKAIEFLDLHIRHHQKQIERITGHEHFPG